MFTKLDIKCSPATQYDLFAPSNIMRTGVRSTRRMPEKLISLPRNLLLVLCLLLALPANSDATGTWYVEITGSGYATPSFLGSPQQTTVDESGLFSGTGGLDCWSAISYATQAAAADSESGSDAKVVLYYVPSADEPPPTQVLVRQFSYAYTFAYGNPLNDFVTYSTADDGLGDPAVFDFLDAGVESTGTHCSIYPVEATSGTCPEVQPPGSTSTMNYTGKVELQSVNESYRGIADGILNSSVSTAGSLSYWVSATNDDRTLQINGPTTYYNPTPNNMQVDPNKDPKSYRAPNVRGSDGSYVGDMGLALSEADDYPDSTPVTYTAVANNWATINSVASWSSSLSPFTGFPQILADVNDSIAPLKQTYTDPQLLDMNPAAGSQVVNNDATKTDTITLNYTNGDNTATGWTTGNDGDGATMQAKATMRLHLPVENYYDTGQYQNLPPDLIGTSTPTDYGGDASVNYNDEVDFSTAEQDFGCILASGSAIYPLVASEPASWPVMGIVAAASYKLGTAQPPTPTTKRVSATEPQLESDYQQYISGDPRSDLTPKISHELADALRNASGSPGGLDAWISNHANTNKLQMILMLYHGPTSYTWAADTYGSDGYDGPTFDYVKVSKAVFPVDNWTYNGADSHH